MKINDIKDTDYIGFTDTLNYGTERHLICYNKSKEGFSGYSYDEYLSFIDHNSDEKWTEPSKKEYIKQYIRGYKIEELPKFYRFSTEEELIKWLQS